jgi:hypothetical protein
MQKKPWGTYLDGIVATLERVKKNTIRIKTHTHENCVSKPKK